MDYRMQIWMHGVGEHGIIRFACEDRRSSIPGYMDFRMLLWMLFVQLCGSHQHTAALQLSS